MIIGKNKHLSFSGKPTKGGCVQNAVTVTFETGAVWICIFCDCSVARTNGMGGKRGKCARESHLAR
jgi:hypothetical protein